MAATSAGPARAAGSRNHVVMRLASETKHATKTTEFWTMVVLMPASSSRRGLLARATATAMRTWTRSQPFERGFTSRSSVPPTW